MKQYECKHCNFETHNKNNYKKHLDTKKHNEKVLKVNELDNDPSVKSRNSSTLAAAPKTGSEKDNQYDVNEYKCISCGNKFNRMSNLTRHHKICVVKSTNESKLHETIKFLEIEKDHYKTEMTHYKNLLIETGKLVKTSVNALTYVVDNYDEAPPIKQIKFNDINTKKISKVEFIETLLSAYKHKTINKYLGDSIIAIYKKETPGDQSIWNTDTYRMTYLLKELLENKTSNWIVDKKGHKTIEYIIDPILKHVRKLLLQYNTYASKKKMKPGSVDFEIALENSKAIVKLANEIDDGVTGKAVLKYISPKMSLGKNKIKEIELDE